MIKAAMHRRSRRHNLQLSAEDVGVGGSGDVGKVKSTTKVGPFEPAFPPESFEVGSFDDSTTGERDGRGARPYG